MGMEKRVIRKDREDPTARAAAARPDQSRNETSLGKQPAAAAAFLQGASRIK